MKHLNKVVIMIVVLLVLTQITVLADGTTTQTTPEPTADPAIVETGEQVTITPDSALYPAKLMLESISVSLTVDETSKAELLVTYANRRLLEADIMQAQDNEELAQELVEASLDLVAKANDTLLGTEDADAADVIVNIEQAQDEVLIRLNFLLKDGADQEDIDELLNKAEEEVIKTVVTNAFLTSKDNFFDSKDDFADAKDAYKTALESGDEEAIAAAYQAVLDAEALKDQLEAVKDEFDTLKNSFDGYGEGRGQEISEEAKYTNNGIGNDRSVEDAEKILVELYKYAESDEEIAEFIVKIETAIASDSDLDKLLKEAEKLLKPYADEKNNGKGQDKDKENNGRGNDKDDVEEEADEADDE